MGVRITLAVVHYLPFLLENIERIHLPDDFFFSLFSLTQWWQTQAKHAGEFPVSGRKNYIAARTVTNVVYANRAMKS